MIEMEVCLLGSSKHCSIRYYSFSVLSGIPEGMGNSSK